MNTYGRLLPMREPLDRAADEPTTYEVEAARLGLATEAQQISDPKLRQWVRLHHRTLYVPENVLTGMGVPIETWGFAENSTPRKRDRKAHRTLGE